MSLAPILMMPAFRYGSMTPWGGSGLRTLFGKNIPDDRTGEALEISAIPGLESRDEKGRTLPELLDLYGEELAGKGFVKPFPLLLKLLDARDVLSVQVHPNNEYAAQVEHKLGKTEAWHILHAEPGAELVYCVKEGTTKEALKEASQQGAAVEKLLRKVPVKAGETYYIPAGTVHAIGAGIMLYEIQQSSDVTYRFYDWERRDKNGNKRELHIDKAVDVTNVDVQLDAAVEKEVKPGLFQLLDEKYFGLQRLCNYDGKLEANFGRFRLLTALAPSTLTWEGGKLELPAGQSVLLPADGYEISIQSPAALISYPNA